MSRYSVHANPDADAALSAIVIGGGRSRYFRTFRDAVSWVACMEALERDIARVVRFRMLQRRDA